MKVRDENLILSSISMLIIKTMLNGSNYFRLTNFIEMIVEFLAYGLILVSLVNKFKVTKRDAFAYFAIVLLLLHTGIQNSSFVFVSSFFMLLVSKYINKSKIIEVIYKTILFVLLIHCGIYFFRYIVLEDVSGIVSKRNRHLFGFSHPNIISGYAMWMFLAYSYLNRKNLKKIFIAEILLCLLLLYTNSRSVMVVLVVFNLLLILLKYNDKLLKVIAKNIFVVCLTLSLIGLYMYMHTDYTFIKRIDELSSSRLFFASKAIENYGFTLIGQINDVIEVSINNYKGAIITDVLYYALIYKFGIIYVFIIIWLIKKAVDTNDKFVSILIIIWSIFGLFEMSCINFVISFPLIFAMKESDATYEKHY